MPQKSRKKTKDDQKKTEFNSQRLSSARPHQASVHGTATASNMRHPDTPAPGWSSCDLGRIGCPKWPQQLGNTTGDMSDVFRISRSNLLLWWWSLTFADNLLNGLGSHLGNFKKLVGGEFGYQIDVPVYCKAAGRSLFWRGHIKSHVGQLPLINLSESRKSYPCDPSILEPLADEARCWT